MDKLTTADEPLIRDWANCRIAEVDFEGDVWIADPQTGHWLNPENKLQYLAWREKQKYTRRYEVRAIRNPECTGVSPIADYQTDCLEDAKREITNLCGAPFGYAIYDAATRLIDWGSGFGVELPDPEA